MSKLTLESQLARFFRNGFKKAHFTADIYKAMYIKSGIFIAHFDRNGFYKARFQDPSGFLDTMLILKGLKARRYKCAGNETRELLGKHARDYLQRMEMLDTFIAENQTLSA